MSAHQSFPKAVQSAFSLMKEILAQRSDSELQGSFKTKKGQWRHVPDDSENGNLGKLVFVHNTLSFGLNWIAASPNAELKIEGDIGDIAYELRHIGSGRVIATPTTIFEPHGLLMEVAYDADSARWIDSEYLLITLLDRVLKEKRIFAGHLYLITERIPCTSCTGVIAEFLVKFPLVRCSIFYLWDIYNRGDDEFLANQRVKNVELHKLIWDGAYKTLNMITLREAH